MTTQTILDQHAELYRNVQSWLTEPRGALGVPVVIQGPELCRAFMALYEFIQKYKQADLLAQHAADTKEMTALLLCIARTSIRIRTVYDKYQHLDRPLSDKSLFSDELIGAIVTDLWQAIKDAKRNQEAFEKLEGYTDAGQLAALADEQRDRIADLEKQLADANARLGDKFGVG